MGFAKQNIEEDPRPEIAIGHVGLRVKTLKQSLEFFKLLGARIVTHMPGMAILEIRGGTHLILRNDPLANSTPADFDIMVDDIREIHSRLKRAGYNPTAIGRGFVHRSFTVIEPSGVTLEITSSHVTGPV